MKNNIGKYLLVLFVILLAPSLTQAAPYLYNFNVKGTVPEAGSFTESWSPYWWVNSGGYLKITDGRGSTNKGSLAQNDPWRVLYSKNNPTDTDQGYHPQNIFRLFTKPKWANSREEAYFVIKNDVLSSSSNRNQSNGLLLISRFKDSNNLYYAGVRVDGKGIIKKKINGTYYTLAEPTIYSGTYNRSSSPNLLPKNKWIGLRTDTVNLANGAVEIRLYTDEGWKGEWKLVAKVVDDGSKFGGKAFTEAGNGGIRTDFMDVEFDNFRVTEITG